MTNRVHVALNSSSSLPTVIETTTNDRMIRRKKMWIIFGIIASILIITAIVALITIIFTREDNEIAKNATTKRTTTTTKATTKTSIKTTTNFLRSSTTKTEQIFHDTENITTIHRWKFFDPNFKQTRYWYYVGNASVSPGWIKDKTIFRAYTKPMPGTEPVYAYNSGIGNIWLDTLDMDPISSLPDSSRWTSGGVKFYCYRPPVSSEQLQPIHRYWSQSKVHASLNVSLRMYLLTTEMEANVEPGWTYDKILMYALPLQ